MRMFLIVEALTIVVLVLRMRGRITGRDLAKVVPLVFMVMVLLSAPIVSGASVGVVVGDWAKYGDLEASSTIQGQTFSNLGFSNFEWMKITVQSVSGTSLTLQMLAHYTNGTEASEDLTGDVGSGTGNLSFFILPTSLAVGNNLPSSFGSFATGLTISDIVTRSYAGASREMYHSGYHMSVQGTNANYDMYWDKAKGVLCEMNMSMTMSMMSISGSATMKLKLIETNMWGNGAGGSSTFIPGLPDYALYIIIAVIVVAIAIVVAVALMRRRKTPAPSTGPSEQPKPAVESPKT